MKKITKNKDYCYYVVRSNIKKYRLLLGLTTQQLADKSDFTHQFIRDLESLKIVKRPRLDSISRIADALGIDIRQLFDEVEEKKSC